MVSEQIDEQQKTANTIIGQVVSNKMDKTIVIVIERKVLHPMYKKYIKRTTRLFAHDPKNQCKEGDTVLIKQCRPLSKKKHWELIEIVEHKVA